MSQYPPAIDRLIESLLCLPTVGPKTAGRLAFYLLDAPEHEVEEMIAALQGIKSGVARCAECGNYAEGSLCGICSSSFDICSMSNITVLVKIVVFFKASL